VRRCWALRVLRASAKLRVTAETAFSACFLAYDREILSTFATFFFKLLHRIHSPRLAMTLQMRLLYPR